MTIISIFLDLQTVATAQPGIMPVKNVPLKETHPEVNLAELNGNDQTPLLLICSLVIIFPLACCLIFLVAKFR